jgi:hypothetical protein
MVKISDENGLLHTLIKHSQFKSCGIWNFKKFKICFKISNFQKSFTTCICKIHDKEKQIVAYDTRN